MISKLEVAIKGCFIYRQFESYNKPNKSPSAFYYHLSLISSVNTVYYLNKHTNTHKQNPPWKNKPLIMTPNGNLLACHKGHNNNKYNENKQ